MAQGYAIRVFGSSYLLAILMPEDGIPSYCELKRLIGKNEELLGDNGWESPFNTKAKRIMRDQNKSTIYFTYFIDENAGDKVQYSFRFKMNGVYQPWRQFDSLGPAILPAPKNIRALYKHGNSE
jgi:hypothetical protein